jgi:hypothetical protein
MDVTGAETDGGLMADDADVMKPARDSSAPGGGAARENTLVEGRRALSELIGIAVVGRDILRLRRL